jgi:PAS domain S-box-containing protein
MAEPRDSRTLIVAPVGRDAAVMAAVLEQQQLTVTICADLDHCSRELAAGAGCLLLTEEGLATPAAESLVTALEHQPSWSALPIVVLTSGNASQRIDLLQRLGLSMGTVTLLHRPLQQTGLLNAVQVALSARRRQYEVRDLLNELQQREQMLRERAAALRASESRFREMADGAPAMLWVTDAARSTTFLSRGWYEFTGAPVDSGLGDGWVDPIHEADRERVRRELQQVMDRGEPLRIEYRLRVADGSYRWVLDVGRPRFDAGRALIGYIGSVMDIQELRVAERETERNRVLLDAVLESLPVGIVIADPHGRLIRWNRAHETLWGFAGSEPPSIPDVAADRRWTGWWPDTGERIAPGEWPLSRALLEREGVPGRLVEIERFDDGGRRFLISGSAPVLDADGELIAAVAAHTDVTENVQMERALREADQRKDEFLATLAHELRNPLAPIRTAVEMLKLSAPGDRTVGTCRDIIDRQLQDLTRLVDDLLEVSRITRGKLELRNELVSLRQIVDRAVEAARPLIDAARHTLVVSMPDREAWLLADATRCAQVFTNLLNNAARYTPPGGRIHLSAETSGGEVCVSVRDNGMGIDEAHLPRIFEMFSQAAPALERSGHGLGVGLALAKGLVELHGGAITARSGGIGRGSEFSVRLPEAESPVGPPECEIAPAARGDRQTILVVDDNRDSADALAMVLELMGHEVRVAYDGEQALTSAERIRPDVVLLDIGLPAMNGYQVAKQIRATPWGKGVLIVAQTGWGQQQDKSRALAAGFDHHLTKPIDLAVITRLLDRTAA